MRVSSSLRRHEAYQQQVIEEEDLSLKLGQFLFMRLVGIRHLKQATAAHQTPVRHGKDLQRRREGDGDDRRNRGQTGRREIIDEARRERNFSKRRQPGKKKERKINSQFSAPEWTAPRGSRR